MTPGTKSLLVLSLCAALFIALGAACKKKTTEATGGSAGSGTAAAAVDAAAAAPAIDAAAPAPEVDAAQAAPPTDASLPPELKALDDTVKPILAVADEAARTKAACKALDTITTQIAAVRKNPPAGVDGVAWNEIVERMAGTLTEFELECAEGSASDTKALAEVAETAKEFLALLAKKAP